jgi:ATP adenylyltransferase
MDEKISSDKPLWAPWRIEYILSPKSGECFLCDREKSKKSEDEFMVLYRGENAFIILNAYPYNPGHLLICPYKHIGDISDIDKKTLYEISDLSVMAKNILSEIMNPSGFNIGYNLGVSAGAGLEEHLHLHVVPRWNGDNNFMPIIGKTRIMPQALKETAAIIRKKIK